ncbi:MAG: class I SAM-dependent methyltransferase [Permianibacter sp.]
MKPLIALAALALSFSVAADSGLQAAVKGSHRDPANVDRDRFRHPVETLQFFGIKPNQTVVEIAPGGGWYTEILAPYLRDNGKLYAAHADPETTSNYQKRSLAAYKEKLAANPAVYDKVELTVFAPPAKVAVAPAGSADLVVTFRNVHNWWMRGGGDANVQAAFKGMYDALKPGGVLGVVEHRLPASRPASEQENSGYMHESYVIKMAEAVGFKLEAKSEINANPEDTADHENGVWALPPTLTNGEKDRARYVAIGESDRMTLKFVKPKK